VIFLLDNDIPDALARVLTQAGHKPERLRDLLPRNSDDLSVLKFAHDFFRRRSAPRILQRIFRAAVEFGGLFRR
jgi:hypothetical protein